jgi:glycosyltransferase involved in cell wall biosynthesis
MVDVSATRIGIISEVYGGPTPPAKYGGISATVYDISEELVRRGRDVTLFATEGSSSSGKLIVVPPGDLSSNAEGPLPPYVRVALEHKDEIDVWIDGSHHKRFARHCAEWFPKVRALCPSWNPNRVDCPVNTVVQSPHLIKELDKPEDTPFFFAGIPLQCYSPNFNPSVHPHFMRSVSINVLAVYKGTDLLVAAAAKHGFPLQLYGPCPDQKWFKKEIEPYLKQNNITYLGECGRERSRIMRGAVASFTLSTWPEPGSRVSLESFALGCPVIALPSGCFPYYIEDGVNGALCEGRDPDSIYEAYLKVLEGGSNMRLEARRTAEEKFDLGVYVDNWEKMFKRMMEGDRWA